MPRARRLVFLLQLYLLFGGAHMSFGFDGNSLFPVALKLDSEEWREITPSEAVQLVAAAVAKQPKYGSARARVLVYIANEFKSERDEMIQLFGKLRTTDQPAALREKTNALLPDLADTIQKFNWAEITITEDSSDVIEKYASWSKRIQPSVYLSTDKIKVVFDGMLRQADVALPGRQNRMLVRKLSTFYVPLQPAQEQYVRSAAKTSNYVKYVRGGPAGPRRTTIFALHDGNVVHDYSTSEDGSLTEETWQGQAKEWDGGIRVPTSHLNFRYTNGVVSSVHAAAIRHAEFNVRVEPSEFAVAIPAGTTVVDMRDGEPAVVRVKEPIKDLVTALKQGLPTKVRSASNSSDTADATDMTRRRIGLIIINVLVVALLLFLVLEVRRRTSASA